MPSAAVSGAAIAESLTVVQNEFHAAPAHRMPWRSPFDAERLHVVPQRQRVVAAPGLDEAAGERHRVDHDREQRPRQRDAVAERGARRPAAASAGRSRPCRTATCTPCVPSTRRCRKNAPSANSSSTMPSVAARPWSSCAPTTEKKISVDSTPKLPPSRIGLPKSAIDSMKLIRNALARPGPHQRQRDVGERAPAVGAQRLRRFLHAGRHAFDDADQHEEGDRREREHLRDEHALQAVDPARRLDAERPFEQLVDEAGAAEDAGSARGR